MSLVFITVLFCCLNKPQGIQPFCRGYSHFGDTENNVTLNIFAYVCLVHVWVLGACICAFLLSLYLQCVL